jgi:hypothetical protein
VTSHEGQYRSWLALRGLVIAIALLGVAAVPARAEWAVGLIVSNTLIVFDTASPGTLVFDPISGLGAFETVGGIDRRPVGRTALRGHRDDWFRGQLGAQDIQTRSQHRRATFVGATAAALAGAAHVPTGFDFSPTVDRIRYVSTNDENARLHPDTCVLAANDTDLTPAATSAIVAEAYEPQPGRRRRHHAVRDRPL